MTSNLVAVSMATSALLSFCLLASVTSVTSTPLAPVEPIFSLSELEPYEACLFVCNMCFTTEVPSAHKMMECSNRICSNLLEGKCAFQEFMWLGHHCQNYGYVQQMWGIPKPKLNAKEFKLH